MQGFRVFVIAMWIIILAVTLRGITGGAQEFWVFFSDFAHPWRAQFNTDLTIHLLLFAVWVFWRERSKLVGSACAALCAMGGIFTFGYLLVAISRARGDARALLLGAHATAG